LTGTESRREQLIASLARQLIAIEAQMEHAWSFALVKHRHSLIQQIIFVAGTEYLPNTTESATIMAVGGIDTTD
jgi:hypothetical protein